MQNYQNDFQISKVSVLYTIQSSHSIKKMSGFEKPSNSEQCNLGNYLKYFRVIVMIHVAFVQTIFFVSLFCSFFLFFFTISFCQPFLKQIIKCQINICVQVVES